MYKSVPVRNRPQPCRGSEGKWFFHGLNLILRICDDCNFLRFLPCNKNSKNVEFSLLNNIIFPTML